MATTYHLVSDTNVNRRIYAGARRWAYDGTIHISFIFVLIFAHLKLRRSSNDSRADRL